MQNSNIFSQKHYIPIADLLGRAIANDLSMEDIVEAFADLFEKDYPDPKTGSIFYFKKYRFKEAVKEASEKQHSENQEAMRNIMMNVASRRA
jgi:hypothetical protein